MDTLDSASPPPTLEPELEPTFSSKSKKLPIKRKVPNPNSIPTSLPPPSARDHQPPHPSPFKFHRIWSEHDELRLLQCLLDSSPRDLNAFYSRFRASASTSHSYSKSQLAEKLRRLRKKFRSISSRLARDRLDISRLSPHDRAIYDLSERLWSPKYASFSPFSGRKSCNNAKIKDFRGKRVGPSEGGLMGIRVGFVADLGLVQSGVSDENGNHVIGCTEEADGKDYCDDDDVNGNRNDADAFSDVDGDMNEEMREVNVDYDFGVQDDRALDEKSTLVGGWGGRRVSQLVKTTAMDAFDKSLNEVKKMAFSQGALLNGDGCGCLLASFGSDFITLNDMPRRLWEQRLEEFDVFSGRLRLIIEEMLSKK